MIRSNWMVIGAILPTDYEGYMIDLGVANKDRVGYLGVPTS